MSNQTEEPPVAVPCTATQAGEVARRWSWTEPSVWTERMLTALEKGVKGGQWFSLIDKVYRLENLRRAFTRVKSNQGGSGVDHQTIEMFEERLEENLMRLQAELKEGNYRPRAIRRVWIPKPGRAEKRPIGIPAVRDRVVQTALRSVLEPIFERDFAEHSYGFRPGRGCKDALREVDGQLKSGNTIVVDADLKSFFDTIPKDRLMKLVSAKISDGRVLALLEAYLNQNVLDGLEEWTPEEGTPQGAIISPLLANIYLNPLDGLIAQEGYHMVRYADDFVILCPDQEKAEQALKMVESWTEEAGLKLHPEKTRVVDAAQAGGFDFLGYHFERGQRRPRDKSRKKFKDTIRRKTRRTDGRSLKVIISDINRTLRGWFEYFKHSHKSIFKPLEGWIRMRLRSILRKRDKRKGRGRGLDHYRWPNAFFAEHGLFSLTKAYAQASQPAQR